MTALSVLLAAALLLVAAVHVAWALGVVWPARNEPGLAAMVVGETWRRRMPGRGLTLVVAACLAAAAGCALAMRWPPPLGRLTALPGFILAAIFLARGCAGYLPAWRKAHDAEPFARLDRLVYAPLCLALGTGFLVLAVSRWSAP